MFLIVYYNACVKMCVVFVYIFPLYAYYHLNRSDIGNLWLFTTDGFTLAKK